MQQRHDRLRQAEGLQGESGERGAGSGERRARSIGSVQTPGPRCARRAGHGSAKLPALGVQLSVDPLDQGRFAAEQMDDMGNIQQHALGKNVGIDSDQGRELLASRRHAL